MLALGACSAPAPPPDLTRAERFEHDGQDEEALAAYANAVTACRAIRHAGRRARFCAAALRGRAETLDRLGRREEAAAAFEAMADELSADIDVASGALVDAGRIRLKLGQADLGWRDLWRAIVDFPDSTFADEALRLILRDGRRRDPKQLDAVLAELAERLADREVADNLIYARSDLAEHELHDPARALALLDRIAADYPKSGLRDEALWRGGLMARDAGDPEGAVARWRRLLQTRERSLLVGSYHSVYLDDAQLEVGRVLRDDLGRPKQAVTELRRVEAHYPTSVLIDDSLWEIAVCHERLRDPAAACKTLAALARRFPESKYELEQAPALRAELRCDGGQAP